MSENHESCPKCGKTDVKTEVDPNTGQIYLVCANRACRSLRAIGWFQKSRVSKNADVSCMQRLKNLMRGLQAGRDGLLFASFCRVFSFLGFVLLFKRWYILHHCNVDPLKIKDFSRATGGCMSFGSQPQLFRSETKQIRQFRQDKTNLSRIRARSVPTQDKLFTCMPKQRPLSYCPTRKKSIAIICEKVIMGTQTQNILP